jgi:hypothetical protein
MAKLKEREVGAALQPPAQQVLPEEPLYTRYCTAPHPIHPVGEPRIVHALLVASWLGRLIEPLHSHSGSRHE